MADVYEHVTPEMEQRVLNALQARWEASLVALSNHERDQVAKIHTSIEKTINELKTRDQAPVGDGGKTVAQISPKQA
jgi:hypothetical protein